MMNKDEIYARAVELALADGDKAEIEKLLIQASDMGSGKASKAISSLYYDESFYDEDLKIHVGKIFEPDLEKEKFYMFRAAEQGNGDACYIISCWYYYDEIFEKDVEKETEYLLKAAEFDCPDAMMILGNREINDEGEPESENVHLAYYYYLKAAMLGCGDGYYSLGWLFAHGRYVPQNDAIAEIYYAKAEELGYTHEDHRKEVEEAEIVRAQNQM